MADSDGDRRSVEERFDDSLADADVERSEIRTAKEYLQENE